MIIVDTDILIDLALREGTVLDELEEFAGAEGIATTSISMAEYLRGVPPGRVKDARIRVEGLQEIPFGPRASRRYGALMHDLDRRGLKLDAADGMVAAVVLEEGGRLLTRNVRHFGRVPGLELVALPS